MTNIDYTLWPNTDGELGKIKVTIPTNAEDWPDGDALVHNFVYKNGKLVGFVDTKALILNESATTTFPYDYVDISLPSILEGTLTVNRGERCKYLNVKFYNHEWIPAGFTELEFLESSGTQYIDTGIPTDGNFTISCRLQVATVGAVWGRACSPPYADYTGGQSWARLLLTNGKEGLYFYYNWQGVVFSNVESMPPQWDMTQPHDWVAVEGTKSVTLDGSKATIRGMSIDSVDTRNPDQRTHYIFATNGVHQNGTGRATMKLYRFSMQDGDGKVVLDLVPVLNTKNVPGMYDKINNQFYENQGDGTFGYQIKKSGDYSAPFSLRDPYYVAPSGVYAKLIAENTLEIVADTEEVQGDDWVHFANTGEAYEHFSITFKDEALV